jgi:hypothetical protein
VLARLRDRFLTQSDAASALVGSELSLPVRAHDEAPLTGRVLSELDGQAWQQVMLDDGEFEALAKLSDKLQPCCAVVTGR